jgi:hypothetical protein
VEKFDASKAVIGPIPLFPARILAHDPATVFPTGLTIPSPVITTRRLLTFEEFPDTILSISVDRYKDGEV